MMMVGASANENGEPLEGPRLVAGATMSERFVLERRLGRGAMGSVWLARHIALDIDVALKFVDSSLATHPNYVERFRREARAAAQISSPHVVSVLDYGVDEQGFPFMVMEYLSGITLGAYLTENIRPPVDVVARIVTHVARGLERAHELGIIHRDIKPENIFLCGSDKPETLLVKILDFGVAKGNFTASGHGTLAGQLVGSPAHMSPEQARGHKSIDHRSDLFSLGVLAYQCLTGWHPFTGAGLGEVLLSVCTLDPEPPSALVSGLPLAVDAWFEKALAKKRSERFASAREMCLAFYDALGPMVHSSSHPDSLYPNGGYPNPRGRLASSGIATLAAPEDHFSGVVSAAPRESIERATAARGIDPASAYSTGGGTKSRLSAQEAAPATVKSAVQPLNIAEALMPLARIVGVRGVTLLDSTGECLRLVGPEPSPKLDALIFAHARTVAETVESIEGASDPAHLCVRFGALTVYVRWMSSFALVVRGESTLRPLLLTIGSNPLASKLHAMVSEAGSPERAVRLLNGTGQTAGTREPLRASAPTVKLKASRSNAMVAAEKPMRPAERPDRRSPADAARSEFDAESPTLRPGEQRASTNHDSAAEPLYEFSQEEVPTRRERPLVYRGKVVGSQWEREGERPGPLVPLPVVARVHEALHAMHAEPEKRERPLIYRGQTLGGNAKSEDKPKERVRVYRGRIIDE